MPITGKTPIADLGDSLPIDDAAIGLGPAARVEPTLGAPAPARHHRHRRTRCGAAMRAAAHLQGPGRQGIQPGGQRHDE